MLKARPSAKWLNPLLLARTILGPSHDIVAVNYYIARVSSRGHDPEAPARQARYLNALASVPQVKVHEGSFMVSEPWMQLSEPAAAKPADYQWNQPVPALVKVVKCEEKGSDVNLAYGVYAYRIAYFFASACQTLCWHKGRYPVPTSQCQIFSARHSMIEDLRQEQLGPV